MPTKTLGPLMTDYQRAIKAAKKAGWKEVAVKFPDGVEIVFSEKDDASAKLKLVASREPPKPKLVW